MILTSVQIKAADSLYMKNNDITEYRLVKMAAESIYSSLIKYVDSIETKKILILCGNGLNGADGCALALILKQSGARVYLLSAVDRSMNGTTQSYYDECVGSGIEVVTGISDEYDVLVDAVFGISFHGGLDSSLEKLFISAAEVSAFKVALDVPSGVSADSAYVCSGAFKADLTIAVCAKKPCHLLYPAKHYCKDVTVADMNFGPEIFNEINPYLFELSNIDYKSLIHKRDDTLHKGAFGRAGLIVGCTCYRGAAVLAVKAALNCGAGIVSAFVPDTIYGSFASECISAVINPMKSKNGGIDDKSLLQKLDGCTAVLCGSGLGLTDGAVNAVKAVASTDLNVIFDGDAITVISRDLSLLKRSGNTVITPHMGEFARLCGKSIEEIKSQRITLAMQFASQNRCVLVLKDSVSIVALPDGRAFILSDPTSALSKGGSGDVLAGMICSFVAQGYSPAAAAIIAVSLHNACGHAACDELSAFCALPEDFIKMLPSLLK